MYKQNEIKKSKLTGVKAYMAESLEHKVHRILNNKEPIKDGSPIIHTDRKDGVLPSYNIRTDRFEVAVDAMDKVTRSHIAKREGKGRVIDMKAKDLDGGTDGKNSTESSL